MVAEPREKYCCGDCANFRTNYCSWNTYDYKVAHSSPLLASDVACPDFLTREKKVTRYVTFTPTALTVTDKVVAVLTGNPGSTTEQIETILRRDYNCKSHADARLRELFGIGRVHKVKGYGLIKWYLT